MIFKQKNFITKRIAPAGQVTIEFTFSMILTTMLLVGMIKVFGWVGEDLKNRTQAHQSILMSDSGCTDAECPLRQLRPNFYGASKIDAAVDGDILGF